MNCLICKKEFKTTKGSLTRHLKKYHNSIDPKTYYIEYMKNEKKICSCGKECKFKNLTMGFYKTCGDKKCIFEAKSKINKNKILSKDTRKKMSLSALNKPSASLETRKKRSLIAKELKKNNPERYLKQIELMYIAGHTPKARSKAKKSNKENFRKLYTSKPTEKNYYLYLMSDGDGLLKIGVSGKIEQRKKQLIHSYQKNIYIIDSYYENYNNIIKLETKLHHKYIKYHVVLAKGSGRKKEWFKEEILEDIKKDFDAIKCK